MIAGHSPAPIRSRARPPDSPPDEQESQKKSVKNRDLWEQLLAEADRHEIDWVLVKGHVGVKLNERVDALAVAQRDLHARR